MIISVTERGVFKRCRLQWDYSSFNRQGITALTPPTALQFGGMIHKAHENWLLNPDTETNDVVLGVAATELHGLRDRYKKAVGVLPADEELKWFFDGTTLALEMLDNYKKKWGASLPDGFTLVKPEQTLLVPIPGTEHTCSCNCHPGLFHTRGAMALLHDESECPNCGGSGVEVHYLEGTLDALMTDEGGRLWVLERKTYSSKPRIEVLQENDQFLAYLWCLTKVSPDTPVGGVFYDGMWKRDLSGKRELDDLFHRVLITHSPDEIANFQVQLRDEALDMASNPRIYRNRVWQGCWDCQFDRLCSAEFKDEDSEYVRQRFYTKREVHEWLQQETD